MRTRLIGVVLGALAAMTPLGAADWPQWRGPHGNGVSADANLPLRWSMTQNLAWTAALGGQGVSTPIVVGDRVIVTSQRGSGVRRPGNHPRLVQGGDAAAAGERALTATGGSDKTVFLVEAFARADGRRLWQHQIDAEGDLTPVHDKHNLATPSPVSDGARVYAWFGTGQIVALDLDGRVAWQRHLGREIAPFDIQWGHGSSPALHGDLLYLLCDHTPTSYLLAVDKATGRDRWKADRGRGRASYSTPFIVAGAAGAEVIINSNERVDAYDATKGTPLWHTGGPNRFPIPVPVFHDGIIYMSRGYRSGPYLAMRPGGRGDVTASHVMWNVETGAPYVSSLAFANGLLFMANDAGVITAADAKTGERVWQHRVSGVFSASPLVAADRVYFVSESGRTIVMRASRTAEVLAENDLDAHLVASPAASDGHIFLRSDDRVFAIGAGAAGAAAAVGAAGVAAAAGVAGASSAVSARTTPAQSPRDALVVSTAWLADHLRDPNLVILQLSDRGDYDAGHIPGARYLGLADVAVTDRTSETGLTLQMPAPEDLRARLQKIGISDDSRIVVSYGRDRLSGATRVLLTLEHAGLGDRASLLDGGSAAWLREGRPMTTEAPPVGEGRLSPLRIQPVVVDAEFVRARVGTPGVVVIDGRLKGFYDGVQTGGSTQRPHRTGHITGAKNLPYTETLTADQTLQSPQTLSGLFSAAGAKPGDTVVAYCHIGQQATAVIFAARTLGYKVLLYDGSFEEWSRRADLPVTNPSKKDPQ